MAKENMHGMAKMPSTQKHPTMHTDQDIGEDMMKTQTPPKTMKPMAKGKGE